MTAVAHVALGSNLGDRAALIRAAVSAIGAMPGTRVRALSALIETDPVGPPGQGAYLNAAAALTTALNPAELMAGFLAIERELGRDRSRTQRWGPRTVDIDLLLFEHVVIESDRLTLPHPRLHERAFVLRPLAEIAPHATHPRLGRSVIAMLNALDA